MSTTSQFSLIGCVHKFLLAAEKVGFTSEHLNRLAEDKTGLLANFRSVIEGTAEIRFLPNVIDLGREPYAVGDLVVFCHRRGGKYVWDPEKALPQGLHLPVEQGAEAVARLVAMRALNANVLDYLLAHPLLIPQEWEKGGCTYYFGTTYRQRGTLVFRGLFFRNGVWEDLTCEGWPNGTKDRFVCHVD